jgi:hypothetical protein
MNIKSYGAPHYVSLSNVSLEIQIKFTSKIISHVAHRFLITYSISFAVRFLGRIKRCFRDLNIWQGSLVYNTHNILSQSRTVLFTTVKGLTNCKCVCNCIPSSNGVHQLHIKRTNLWGGNSTSTPNVAVQWSFILYRLRRSRVRISVRRPAIHSFLSSPP